MHASCCLPTEMETNPHTSFLESYQRSNFRTYFLKLACKFSQQRRKHPTSGMRVLILTQHGFLRTGQSLSTLSTGQPPALEVKAPSVPAQYRSPFGTDPLTYALNSITKLQAATWRNVWRPACWSCLCSSLSAWQCDSRSTASLSFVSWLEITTATTQLVNYSPRSIKPQAPLPSQAVIYSFLCVLTAQAQGSSPALTLLPIPRWSAYEHFAEEVVTTATNQSTYSLKMRGFHQLSI